ncbi:hypothetical protein GTW40_11120 [Streptomyces sp. SID4985]|uniref:hypothetical protein n=1 Tax=Streptomyces sp. SID4985 TaxID=2690292 RepID=UPI00136BC1DC|nr:hypothetical protein [Streptomyces sp. SID4985]MYQ45607.1 hypothetical protein [Streptomyces sp. SID4985]
MAKSGYGKRSAGDETPHGDPDFAHLSPRDREIAVFVDHLDDGHAMGYKAIAAVHPRYGQQAVRTSLKRVTAAGHLRHIREHLTIEDNSMRWVTRTYWSRTPRSPEWWAEFVRERKGLDVTDQYESGLARAEEPAGEAVPAEPGQQPSEQHPEQHPEEPSDEPGAAYRTLAELRDADPRMSLSASDCRSLASLAAQWLALGATPQEITKALTDGLPPAVTNPGGLARKRLEDKMPPTKAKVRQKAGGRRARVTRVIMACATCDADERTTEIIDGICRECHAEIEADEAAEAETEGPGVGYVPETFLRDPADDTGVVDVTHWAAELRRAAGLRPRAGWDV